MLFIQSKIHKLLSIAFCLSIGVYTIQTLAYADSDPSGSNSDSNSDSNSGVKHNSSSHAAMNQHKNMDHSKHQEMMKTSKTNRSVVTYNIPDLTLINLAGEKVSVIQELSPDKPILLNFIFTTCTTICPVMSATFAQTQKLLGSDIQNVRMVSISIDPEQDTPEKLRAYAQKFKAQSQWHFLTGNVDDIMAVLLTFDVYRGNKMSHEPVTLLRKKKDDPWVRLDGLTTAKELVIEYHNLLKY